MADGFVLGRGAWDNKSNGFSLLEAMENLIKTGYKPHQTIYFFMGADEEVNGLHGAKMAAAMLAKRGVKLEFLMDEGMVIAKDLIPGVKQPVALIALAQKGYISVRRSVDVDRVGYSSMPPRESVIGVLSAWLSRLEKDPLPERRDGLPLAMMETLAPEMPMSIRVVMSNLWLFKPIVIKALAKSDPSRAQLHTTTALTVVNGGIKDNVLPGHVEAKVNFCIMPGDTTESVLEHVRNTLADPRIQVAKDGIAIDPSRVSSAGTEAYRCMERAVRQVYPYTLVSPGLFSAFGDAEYFEDVAQDIHRFSPIPVMAADAELFHGLNERMNIADYIQMIRFYRQLLLNMAEPAGKGS
ncbi:MAG: M20/M25/M40 family metallo-hydrolase [Candidatus Protistobacter heckmanni]|nr:M20/M25/M40 family metallo-hydrolase [Candidatus Protistobacter heckmanni]